MDTELIAVAFPSVARLVKVGFPPRTDNMFGHLTLGENVAAEKAVLTLWNNDFQQEAEALAKALYEAGDRDLLRVQTDSNAEYALHKIRQMATSSVPNCVNLDAIDRVITEVKLIENPVTPLQKFKDYVHQRLDAAGVAKHEEQNKINGCRIGARLDDVLRPQVVPWKGSAAEALLRPTLTYLNAKAAASLQDPDTFIIIRANHLVALLDRFDKLTDESLPQEQYAQLNNFCEVAGQVCTFNYCNENGCNDRKRNYAPGMEPGEGRDVAVVS